MSYSIKVADSGDYILIDVEGDVDGKVATQYILDSHKLGEELGIMNFLVDLRNSRNIQMVGDNYHFVNQELPKTPGIIRGAKVACVVSPDDHSHDFIETVMQNSRYNLTIFRDMNEALDYLRSE